MFVTSLPASPVPKYSTPNFEPMGNYYIVRQNRRWHYFPVKVEKHPPNAPTPILKFEKAPPVLMEGFVVTQRRIYLVSVQDLLRGIVRTSNEYRIDKEKSSDAVSPQPVPTSRNPARTGESRTSSASSTDGSPSSDVPASSYAGDVRNLIEPGTLEALGVEGDSTLDRLVLEQEQALHGHEDPEEER